MYRKILPWRMNRNRDNADNPNLACSSAEAKHVHCLSPPKKKTWQEAMSVGEPEERER